MSAGLPPSMGNERGRDARAPLPFLNPFEDVERHRHHLPHWQQGDAWQFVTWRLADSLPEAKLDEWSAEKAAWMRFHPPPWDEATEKQYHERFSARVDEWLDAGHGSCVLGKPACGEAVARAIHHFAGSRYRLGPFVVMPNHVHVLFQPVAGHKLERIVHSWKSYTAKEVNRLEGRSGPLWQEDYWDRMIRNEAHWNACRRYVIANPANLRKGEYVLDEGSAEQRSAGVPPAMVNKRGQDARAPFF